MVINDSCESCVPNFSIGVIRQGSQTGANWAIACKCILKINSSESFIHFLHYTVSCITEKNAVMIFLQLYFLIFVHCTSRAGIIFYTFQFQVHNTISFLPSATPNVFLKMMARKNLLLWETLLRKFILFVFRPTLPI